MIIFRSISGRQMTSNFSPSTVLKGTPYVVKSFLTENLSSAYTIQFGRALISSGTIKQRRPTPLVVLTTVGTALPSSKSIRTVAPRYTVKRLMIFSLILASYSTVNSPLPNTLESSEMAIASHIKCWPCPKVRTDPEAMAFGCSSIKMDSAAIERKIKPEC